MGNICCNRDEYLEDNNRLSSNTPQRRIGPNSGKKLEIVFPAALSNVTSLFITTKDREAETEEMIGSLKKTGLVRGNDYRKLVDLTNQQIKAEFKPLRNMKDTSSQSLKFIYVNTDSRSKDGLMEISGKGGNWFPIEKMAQALETGSNQIWLLIDGDRFAPDTQGLKVDGSYESDEEGEDEETEHKNLIITFACGQNEGKKVNLSDKIPELISNNTIK